MNKSMISICVLLGLSCTSVNAAGLNMRHEFKPSADNGAQAAHADRIAVGHRFANGIGFGVEAKWSHDSDSATDNLKSNGTAVDVSYEYKITDTLTFTPQYVAESKSDKVEHQANFKITYKIQDDWTASFRHRYAYIDKSAEGATNSHYNRWTAALGYRLADFGLGVAADYQFDQSNSSGWEGKSNYLKEINFTAEYKGLESGWRPFGEIGFEAYDGDANTTGKDSFRPRYRVGLKYSF
jgi:hypothetical protein